jgi:hypothetical protein
MIVTRILIAALLAAALAASAAYAQRADSQAPLARQELRWPDTRDAAERPGWATPSPLVAPWPATPPADSAPAAVGVTPSDAGIDWAAIAIGSAGGLLAAAGIAGLAVYGGRLQRRRRTA